MTKSSPNKPGHEHWFGLLLASQRFAMMRSNVVILTFATFAGIARAFTCDGDAAEAALAASEEAFRGLRTKGGWTRETGTLKFTHDLNDDADISEYGYPGAMLYARPSFAGGLSPVFRLAPSDALVVVLCTPPETRYFGLSTYVWRRQGSLLPTSRVVSASCGNAPVNSRTIRSGYPSFDRPLVMVSTGDAATFSAVSDAFVAAGVPAESLNLEELPFERVNFGRSLILDRADDLTFSYRVYDANTREYAKQAWKSVMIIRSPRGRTSKPEIAFPAAPPPPSVNLVRSERHLKYIAVALSDAIKRELLAKQFRFSRRGRMIPVDVDRERCLSDPGYSPFRAGGASDVNIQSGCFGETSDCTYAVSSESIDADDPFVVVFVGADHVKLGNAAFSNLAAYHTGGAMRFISAAAVRVAAFADDRMWTRSDDTYVFAHAFASPGRCVVFRNMPDVPCVEVDAVRGDSTFFVSRDYLAPSGSAPDAEQLLPTSVDYYVPA